MSPICARASDPRASKTPSPVRTSNRARRRPKLKLISGGQTGADRAALDWAIRNRIPHGGWCPKGRLAEDGVIGPEYRLRETPLASYAERTEWNLRDSQGTVIFSMREELSGGSLLTANIARRLKKPVLRLCYVKHSGDAAARLKEFVARHQTQVLNVAGPRATEEPRIAAFVEQTLEQAFGAAKPAAQLAPVSPPRTELFRVKSL